MDPTIDIANLDKVKKEFKHHSQDKFDTVTLNKCIRAAAKLEKKLSSESPDKDKDHISQQKYSDLQQMLKMFTKYAIKSNPFRPHLTP